MTTESTTSKKGGHRLDAKAKKKLDADLASLMVPVNDLVTMTGMSSWKRLAEFIAHDIAACRDELLEAEGKHVVRLQQRVRAFRDLLDEVGRPVKIVRDFLNEKPLFAQEVKAVPRWNATTGTVALEDRKP